MAKSQQTFNKREKEIKRQKKKKEKLERREQRKKEKSERGKLSFEDMISYVDEYGNITSTPPDPSKREKINADEIVLGIPSSKKVPFDPVHHGKVKFFNEEKGYGFIIDSDTQQSIFVHINHVPRLLKENEKVSFEIEKGPKGLVAVKVRLSESTTKEAE